MFLEKRKYNPSLKLAHDIAKVLEATIEGCLSLMMIDRPCSIRSSSVFQMIVTQLETLHGAVTPSGATCASINVFK